MKVRPCLPCLQARPAGGGVRGLLDAVAALKVEYKSDKDNDFVAQDVAELGKYGLEAEKPASLRIEIKRAPGGPDAASRGALASGSATLLVGNKTDDKGEKFFARLASEKNIVKIAAKALEPITGVLDNPAALRDRDLVHMDPRTVDAIDINNGATLLKLRQPAASREALASGWKLYRESVPSQKVDSQAVIKLLMALAAKRQVKDFPDPKSSDSDLQLDKPSTIVSLWTDGIDRETKKEEKKDAEAKKDGKKDGEKKDDKKEAEKKPADAEPKLKSDKPTIKLTFGKRNSEKGTVVVKRETTDGTTLLTVPDSLLDLARAEAVAYLDRDLPSFVDGLDQTQDVARLVLKRPGETWEVEKETKDGKTSWKLKQPKELTGQLADAKTVEIILARLKQLHAEKWLKEKPSESDLAQYGLASPPIEATVVVTKDGKPQEHVYRFGKETEDKKSIHARLGGREAVFLVRSEELLLALQDELRDRKVLTFDQAKVRGLALSGWKSLYKDTGATLDLERKADKTWTVKAAPAGFKLDGTKTDAFLTSLAHLQLIRFVKGGAKDEYGLGEATRALKITITVEGEKTPATLIIGKLNAGAKAYYAQSSNLAGAVFLLPQDRFSKLFEPIEKGGGADYFSKK